MMDSEKKADVLKACNEAISNFETEMGFAPKGQTTLDKIHFAWGYISGRLAQEKDAQARELIMALNDSVFGLAAHSIREIEE